MSMTALALLLPLLCLALASPAVAGDTFDPRHLAWTEAEFKAQKLFLTARSAVRLRSVPAANAAAEWIESPHGVNVQPAGPQVIEITLETSGVGGESTDQVWFDPARADAFQRLKTRHGKKGYRKAIRFSDEGTFIRRSAPSNGAEGRLPPAEWSKIEIFFYPHAAGDGCAGVTEPSVLFYVLSADAGLREGASRRLCVFSDKQVVPVEVAVTGSEEVEVDYVEKPARESASRRVDAWKVAVRPLAEDADFEFLGLDGAVEVLLEKTSRLPVELRGRIRGFGRVAVRLTAVERGQL